MGMPQVCTGDGARYDKHYDNGGAGDERKLTALLYLNGEHRREMGGESAAGQEDGLAGNGARLKRLGLEAAHLLPFG